MHPNDGRVVSNFVAQALKGKPISLYGDGGQSRSLRYVEDLIQGYIRLMDRLPEVTGLINLGNLGEFTIRELAKPVIEMTGSRSKFSFEPLLTDGPKERQPDIAHAKEQLDWQPRAPLRDGLKPTIAYFDRLLSAGDDSVKDPGRFYDSGERELALEARKPA
jgi:UDP-glucuronate decarboxylase